MPRALIVEIFGNAKQFTEELDRAAGKTRSMGKVAGVAGLAIAGGLAFGLEKSVKAAVEGQQSQVRLEAAFKQSGESATKYSKQIDEAEASGRNLGFDNIQLRESLGSLEIATHSHAKAIHDLGVAEDIARFKHTDLTTASKTLTMAMAGSQRAIKQLGLSIPPVTQSEDNVKAAFKDHTSEAYKLALANAKVIDKNKQAADTIQLVSDKLHGQASAFANTAQGGVERMHAQLGAVEENLGNALLPTLGKVTSALASLTGYLAEHTTVAKIAVIALAGVAAGLIAVKIATIQWSATLLANPIFLVVAALTALGIGLYEAWKHSETFRDVVTGAWRVVKSTIEGTLSFFTSTLPNAFMTAKDKIVGAFNAVRDFLKSQWPQILTLISGPFAPLVGLATNAFGIRDKFENAIGAMRDKAGDIVGDIVQFFTGMPGKVGAAIAAGAGDLWHAFTHLFSKLPGWAKDVLGIHSPSTVFAEIGTHIVSGLIKGMESKAGALLGAAEHLLSKYVVQPVIKGGKLAYTGVTDAGKAIAGLAGSVYGGLKGAAGSVGGFIGGLFGGGGGGGGGGDAVSLGKAMAAQMGWTGANWNALYKLWTRESGWNPTARNPTSGAYGIPQALPPTKLPFAGQAAGGSHADAQIRWGLNYIAGRYGNPLNAWAHELAVGWYAKGGIFTRPTIIGVGERGPEAVVPLSGHRTGGDIHVTINGWVGSDQDVARKLRDELVALGRIEAQNVLGGFA